MVNSAPCVLVMGYRKRLVETLQRRQIPFVLWSDRPLSSKKISAFVTDSFPHSLEGIQNALQAGSPQTHFSHVLACVESAVYPASLAREISSARKSNSEVILRCHDKLVMKNYLKEKGIPMTDFLPGDFAGSEEDIFSLLGRPLVIKERSLSGGRGLHIVDQIEDLKRLRGPGKILEKWIFGSEGSVESFLQKGEVCFTNITQYRTPGHTNLLPSHFDASTQNKMLELNQKVLKALGLTWGMSHVEMYITETGLLFGEIAIRPPGGYLMELLQMAYNFDSWEAFLNMELGESFAFPQEATSWSASLVLHPGGGRIEKVHGMEKVQSLESLQQFSLKKNLERVVPERQGVGEEIGHILLSHTNQQQMLKDLEVCEKELQFEKSISGSY